MKQQNLICIHLLFHLVYVGQLLLMENKISLTKSRFSSPAKQYRSVKYKIRSTQTFTPNQTFAFGFSTIKHDQSNVTRVSWRRPSSYSMHKNRINRVGEELQNVEEMMKIKAVNQQAKDIRIQLVENDKFQKQDAKAYRVSLPSIIDFQPSNFTSLDPLFLPIHHIQQGIADLRSNLPLPKIQMAKIQGDMINFRAKILCQLQQTHSFGLKQFERLKKMMRGDRVINQETNMRFRRQCQELKDGDRYFVEDFERTKPRLDVLQDEIFSCRPFELKRREGLDEQFPQEYF